MKAIYWPPATLGTPGHARYVVDRGLAFRKDECWRSDASKGMPCISRTRTGASTSITACVAETAIVKARPQQPLSGSVTMSATVAFWPIPALPSSRPMRRAKSLKMHANTRGRRN